MKLNTRQTTNLLKKTLNEMFPGIKFSIRTEKFSMGSSLNVNYTCGPDPKLIEPLINRLQYGNFNGMEDIYEYKDDSGLMIDGKQLETQKYTFVNRELPESLRFQMASALSERMEFGKCFKLESIDQFYENFVERYGAAWDWSDLLRQNSKEVHFVTDDASAIKILSCDHTETEHWSDTKWFWTYEYNKQTYNTLEFPKQKPKVKIDAANAKQWGLTVEDYSEKAIVVRGNTKPIKDDLKALGGRWNWKLRDGAGWIFSKKKEAEVLSLIADYC